MESVKKCRINHRIRERLQQMTGFYHLLDRLIDVPTNTMEALALIDSRPRENEPLAM